MKTFQTQRYKVSFEETHKGGPIGYESTYLHSEGDPASEDLYNQLNSLDGRFLACENQSIRQRNGSQLVQALKEGKTLGIASGFKPSGAYHFGHKLTSSAVSFFQKNGAQIFIPVADIECDLDTKLSKEDYLFWAADNLIDWGANGVNLDASHVYLQSEEYKVFNLAYFLARGLTFDLAIDNYGVEKLCGDPEENDKGEFPFLFAGITQAGDITLPQHKDFGNYHSFMVSGQDQDGHMKMTVELVKKAFDESEIKLIGIQTIPSSFYIPHIRGISGNKASSSEAESTLYLGSGPQKEDLDKRIKSTLHKFNHAIPYHARRGALDLVMYLHEFNLKNKVDFRAVVNKEQYKNLVKNRKYNENNDILLDMNKEESKIIDYLFEQYKESKLNKVSTDEKKAKLNAKIEENKIQTKNQFLSQHRLDEYLIQICEEVGQDNIKIVRDMLPTALIEHQKKRKIVLDYAIQRENYKDPGAWSMEDNTPIQPSFWKVPEKAIVDESKRNPTQWFNIVAKMKDKIIP